MSNTINLVVELGPQTQAKLDAILAALQGATPATVPAPAAKAEPVTEPAPVAKPAAEPAPAAEVKPEPAVVEEPAPAAEPEAPKITKADIQAKVQTLAKPGSKHRDAVKAIIKSYGANVSGIPEDKYPEVMEKLNALTK